MAARASPAPAFTTPFHATCDAPCDATFHAAFDARRDALLGRADSYTKCNTGGPGGR